MSIRSDHSCGYIRCRGSFSCISLSWAVRSFSSSENSSSCVSVACTNHTGFGLGIYWNKKMYTTTVKNDWKNAPNLNTVDERLSFRPVPLKVFVRRLFAAQRHPVQIFESPVIDCYVFIATKMFLCNRYSFAHIKTRTQYTEAWSDKKFMTWRGVWLGSNAFPNITTKLLTSWMRVVIDFLFWAARGVCMPPAPCVVYCWVELTFLIPEVWKSSRKPDWLTLWGRPTTDDMDDFFPFFREFCDKMQCETKYCIFSNNYETSFV